MADDEPRRLTMSPYNVWLNSAWTSIKAEYPSLKVTEIAKKGAELWNAMQDKSEWELRASQLNEQYLEGLEEGNAAQAKQCKKSLESCNTGDGGAQSATKQTKMNYNLLIAATGSVAAIKIPLLVKSLLELNDTGPYQFQIQLVVTEHAKHFFKISDLPPDLAVNDDSSEWLTWKQRGDPVLHIELGKWAHVMVIAPLDANTLAKMTMGICDNLLTCTTRAWDLTKPLLFCPAMNTRMWDHPITKQQIDTLKQWGHKEIPPISKTLMCGDTGVGAMAEVDTIVQRIKHIFDQKVT